MLCNAILMHARKQVKSSQVKRMEATGYLLLEEEGGGGVDFAFLAVRSCVRPI